jgi:hypothetical protein
MGLAEGAPDDATLTRLMNLDPAACPPMALEGFFARNGAMHSDWQPHWDSPNCRSSGASGCW